MKFFKRVNWDRAQYGAVFLNPWYGIAWSNVTYKYYVMAPMPFNLIIGITRRLWFDFLDVFSPLVLCRFHRAYWRGYDEGRKAERKMRIVKDDLAKASADEIINGINIAIAEIQKMEVTQIQ